MNRVILLGRLTRDPDVRYSGNGTEGGMQIARFTLAVDRRRTGADGQREADFIGCVAFGRQAEFAEKYLHQGSKIAITGRIQTGSYSNKDGQKIYTTDVVVEDVEFAESKSASGQNSGSYQPQGQGYARAPQYQQTAQPQYQAAPQPQSMTYAPEHAAEAIAAMQGNSQIGQGFMPPQEDDRPPFA